MPRPPSDREAREGGARRPEERRRAPLLGATSALPLAVLGLGAVGVAFILLERAISPPPPAVILPMPADHPATGAITAIPMPGPPPSGTPMATAPALSRAAKERAKVTPHPMPEQLAAAQRIAETRRVELSREAAAAPPSPPPPPPTAAIAPSIAPPGRVVQLGAFATSKQAEAAAKRFRFRYRGLLEDLPKAVLPYRPAGAARLSYRVQFIAPTQAYAEVTCQRLRAARQSCVVLY